MHCCEGADAEEGKQFLSSESFDDIDEEDEAEEIFFLQIHVSIHQTLYQTIVLLDNQSTIDVFQNKNLLTNLRDSGKTLKIHCYAGVATTSLVGDLSGYG